MVFEISNPKKKKLKPIAIKYICSQCGMPRFCTIDREKTECINCTKRQCPSSEMYIFRQEEGAKLSCCITSELIDEINRSLRKTRS